MRNSLIHNEITETSLYALGWGSKGFFINALHILHADSARSPRAFFCAFSKTVLKHLPKHIYTK